VSKGGLSKVVKDVQLSIKKHCPEILMGVGIAGMITSTVLAVRATPKALILIEEKKKEKNVEKLTAGDTIKAAWKCYIPTAAVGGASVLCLIGASSVNLRRNAALATAYMLSESTLKDYQKKVVEEIGEKKERAVRDAIAKDKVEQNPVTKQEIIITKSGNTLCLDTLSKRYFKSDIDTLKKIANELNRRMRDEVYISVNEFYLEIGLEETGFGHDLGWNIDRGYIDLDFSSQLADDGTPCLVVDYSVAPQYDFR
jgi:hypothetical protein